jgi:hypothetical protein
MFHRAASVVWPELIKLQLLSKPRIVLGLAELGAEIIFGERSPDSLRRRSYL